MQIADIAKAKTLLAALEGAVKSAEAAGRDHIDLTDVLLGVDDALRALTVAAVEALQRAEQAAAAKG